MTIVELTRLVLVAACALSVVAAGWTAHATHPRYTPLMILIAVWSAGVTVGLADIYSQSWSVPWVTNRSFRVAFNSSAAVMIGGWAVFGIWVSRDANALERSIEGISNGNEEEDVTAVPAAVLVDSQDMPCE